MVDSISSSICCSSSWPIDCSLLSANQPLDDLQYPIPSLVSRRGTRFRIGIHWRKYSKCNQVVNFTIISSTNN